MYLHVICYLKYKRLRILLVLEEQKLGIQKESSELRNTLREVEKARLDARRELQELRRQIKMLDGEKAKLCTEVNELQSRVARDEEREEGSRKENFGLKQKVSEALESFLYTFSGHL